MTPDSGFAYDVGKPQYIAGATSVSVCENCFSTVCAPVGTATSPTPQRTDDHDL
jgi:hypothetical protein